MLNFHPTALFIFVYTLLMHAFHFPSSFSPFLILCIFPFSLIQFFLSFSFNTLHYVFIYCFEMLFNFVKKVFSVLLFLHILLTSSFHIFLQMHFYSFIFVSSFSFFFSFSSFMSFSLSLSVLTQFP